MLLVYWARQKPGTRAQNLRISSRLRCMRPCLFVATCIGLLVVVLITLRATDHGSPLTFLPGPPSQSLLYGNSKQIINVDNYCLVDEQVWPKRPHSFVRAGDSTRRKFDHTFILRVAHTHL
ncbi:hypothetical protein C8Q80DRAFT_1172618 [Daedaleopsis nitida]|nr:hypothetical protein C8Q80DRAFT_1172618 [Daedaleopsis nitida]